MLCTLQAATGTPSAARAAAAAGQHQQARGIAQPAEAESSYVPAITVDRVGAISVIGENDPAHEPGVYRNVDGYREEDGRYAAFMADISSFIPQQRQFTDPVRTFAYGTDASFYRLNPRLVVKVGGPADSPRSPLLESACACAHGAWRCLVHPGVC